MSDGVASLWFRSRSGPETLRVPADHPKPRRLHSPRSVRYTVFAVHHRSL